jgi:hypothetical protein
LGKVDLLAGRTAEPDEAEGRYAELSKVDLLFGRTAGLDEAC